MYFVPHTYINLHVLLILLSLPINVSPCHSDSLCVCICVRCLFVVMCALITIRVCRWLACAGVVCGCVCVFLRLVGVCVCRRRRILCCLCPLCVSSHKGLYPPPRPCPTTLTQALDSRRPRHISAPWWRMHPSNGWTAPVFRPIVPRVSAH